MFAVVPFPPAGVNNRKQRRAGGTRSAEQRKLKAAAALPASETLCPEHIGSHFDYLFPPFITEQTQTFVHCQGHNEDVLSQWGRGGGGGVLDENCFVEWHLLSIGIVLQFFTISFTLSLEP